MRLGSRFLRLLAVSVLCLPWMVASTHAMPEAGEAAPDFALKDLDGRNQRLSEFQGEVVVLNFWATWCGKCRDMVNELANAQRADEVRVITVNLDREAHRVEHVAEDVTAPLMVLVDADGRVGKLYKPRRLPYSLVIDQEGIVRQLSKGYRRHEVRDLVTFANGIAGEPLSDFDDPVTGEKAND